MLPMRGYWIETLERNQFVDVVEEWKSGIEKRIVARRIPVISRYNSGSYGEHITDGWSIFTLNSPKQTVCNATIVIVANKREITLTSLR